jgi:hypothetical protein
VPNSKHARPPVEKKLRGMVERYITTLHRQHLHTNEAINTGRVKSNTTLICYCYGVFIHVAYLGNSNIFSAFL